VVNKSTGAMIMITRKLAPTVRQVITSDKLWLDSKVRLETDEEFRKRIGKDLMASKKDIEKNLYANVLAFAYPFGDFGQASNNFPQSRNIIVNLTKSIYPLSFVQTGSSDFPANYAENSFFAKRINVSSKMSAGDLMATLENSVSKSTDYVDDFRENKGWLKGWGIVDTKMEQ
jgi:hypothetical protein